MGAPFPPAAFAAVDPRPSALPSDAPAVFDALGTPVSLVDRTSFMAAIEAWLARRTPATRGRFICFRDVHGVVLAWKRRELAEAHGRALMVAPDGAPLAWLARRRGHRAVAKVCGPEMMLALCVAGGDRGWRHAFYGATPEVLADLVAGLRRHAPGLKIAAAIAPPFGPVSPERMERMIEDLADGRPDFVWVGLGSPKQELWMADHAHKIPGALSLGVGAAFDIHAGRVPRPPAWLRDLGLEWVGRILREPRRLLTRYGRTVPHFIFRVAVEELRSVVRPSTSGPQAAVRQPSFGRR
jgi:N-acetylglucosaminyldiphosphoundecaprenol N-acetyl-beta-D-mannosaminyltransferase